MQEKDDAAAAAAMDKLRAHGSPDLGYAFKDGYLVVTPDSRTGRDAGRRRCREGRRWPTTRTFTADTASLGSDQVVTAWADAGRLSDLLRQQLQSTLGGDAGSLGGVDPLGGLSGLGGSFAPLKGRFVMGMHATNDSVEMRVRSFGGTPAPARPPVRLQHVVADPVAVLAVSGYGKSLATQWSTLASSPMYQSLADQAKLIGLDLPGDLEKLLGDQLPRACPAGVWTTRSGSSRPPPGTRRPARRCSTELLALAGPDAADLPVSTRVDGDTLYVGSSAGTVGRCGSPPTPRTRSRTTSCSGLPWRTRERADAGVRRPLEGLDAGGRRRRPVPAGLQHLKAVGMTVTTDGADSDSTVRADHPLTRRRSVRR